MKAIINALVATTLITSTLACDVESRALDPAADDQHERRRDGYSGEELFLGIFFGAGDVAEHLPMMWGRVSHEERVEALAAIAPEDLAADIDRMAQNPRNAEILPLLERAQASLSRGEVPMTHEDHYALLVEMIRRSDPEYFDQLQTAVASGDRPRIQEALRLGREKIHDIILVDRNPYPGDDQGILLLEVAVAVVAVAVLVYVAVEVEVVGIDMHQSLIYEEMVVDEIANELSFYY